MSEDVKEIFAMLLLVFGIVYAVVTATGLAAMTLYLLGETIFG